MVIIVDLFDERFIDLFFSLGDKDDVIERMVDFVDVSGVLFDCDVFIKVVCVCEEVGIIGFGDGIVILYGKCDGVDCLVLVFVCSDEGVRWGVLDGFLVSLVFFIVVFEVVVGNEYLWIFVLLVCFLVKVDFCN